MTAPSRALRRAQGPTVSLRGGGRGAKHLHRKKGHFSGHRIGRCRILSPDPPFPIDGGGCSTSSSPSSSGTVQGSWGPLGGRPPGPRAPAGGPRRPPSPPTAGARPAPPSTPAPTSSPASEGMGAGTKAEMPWQKNGWGFGLDPPLPAREGTRFGKLLALAFGALIRSRV